MTLNAGTRLGPYEILSPLGAGGMGEVYKAKDTRLERTVAVKVLPSHLSASPDSRQRFEREAKTISQLSHPHICALHDVGSQDGVEYLVMELLEGETLSERLAKGPLPLEQTLRYGQEIADALDKAHRQGIVHRDLKPGNVMLTKTGVKLLDFGLAKAMAAPTASAQLTSLPTQQNLTQEGTILGTFQYMAPEQLEGREADARTDIFALGAVLYEMATGRKAFAGATQASLIGAILHTEPPPISTIQAMSPPALDRVVRACLAKDPEERWQSAADVARELKWIGEGSAAGIAAPVKVVSRRRWREAIAWALAAVALGIAAIGFWRRGSVSETPRSSLRLDLELPAGQKLFTGAAFSGRSLRVAPDGRAIVYVARKGATTELRHRSLESGDEQAIPGTAGALDPFFSPDGRWVGFTAAGYGLRKVALSGGTPIDVTERCTARGGAWSADGSIYFTRSLYGGISRVSQDGGPVTDVTQLDKADGEKSHRWPELLPGGKSLVYAALTGRTWDDAQIVLKRLDTGERRVLIHGGTCPHYAPTGHLVYGRGESLFAVPFDLARLAVTGQPVETARDIYVETSGATEASFAASGTLAYIPSSSIQSRRLLTRVDRSGASVPLSDRREAFSEPAVSPDGRRIAVQFDSEISIFDLERRTFTPLTSGPRVNTSVWTPDGKTVIFGSEKNGPWNIFSRPADGSASETALAPTPGFQVPSDVSPDGKRLLIWAGDPPVVQIVDLPMATGTPRIIGPGRSSRGRFSPDGRWVVYAGITGQQDLFVVPASGGEGRWQISSNGGSQPRWSHSGREIFYLEGENLMAVSVKTEPRFEPGVPRVLFTKPDLQWFDVFPDDEHFLLIEAPESMPRTNLGVVVNWFAELSSGVSGTEAPKR